MPNQLVTYSFLDVVATINGPNGAFSIGSGAGISEEGITVEFAEDQDTTTIGADGTGMHTLHAGQSGSVTIRLLMSSPTNALFDAMYSLDRANPASHGQNTIVISWINAGDITTATGAGFRRFPTNTYAKDAAVREWAFNCIKISPLLGAGS